LAGHLTVAPGGVLNITGEAYLVGTITNRGTVVWSQSDNIYAAETSVFYNAPGGVWDIQVDASYIWINSTLTNALVVNAGLLRKTAGTGTTIFGQGVSFSSSGTVEVQRGTVWFESGYLQSSSGTMILALGGTAPGSQYGRVIAGVATLDGALNITLANGYQPEVGNAFQVITYIGRSGTFSTISGLKTDGLYLTPSYGPNHLTLTAASNSPPLLSAPWITNDIFQIPITGAPGQSCVIQTSTNLTDWEPIYTNILGGEFQFSDTNIAAWPHRFFRAVTPP